MIEPRYVTLTELFAKRVFRIPDYQRFYSWGRKQREDLFGDIRALRKRPSDQHHFMATMVCCKTNEIKKLGIDSFTLYDVVDGQQRLTSLILLLKCVELGLPDGSERSRLHAEIVKSDGALILLQANNVNAHVLAAFLRDGAEPDENDILTDSDRRLRDAIGACKAFAAEWIDPVELAGIVLNQLGFVVFDTEETGSVYTLFEVLNSRGLEVDWLDKAKAVLMGSAFATAASEVARQGAMTELQGAWGELYRDLAKHKIHGREILQAWATLDYGPRTGKIYNAEAALEKLRAKGTSPVQAVSISRRLLSIVRSLSWLHDQNEFRCAMRVGQARLLAVAIHQLPSVSEAQRNALLDQWERVSFRIYGLNAKDARTEVGNFCRLAHGVAKNPETPAAINRKIMLLGDKYPAAAAAEALKQRANCYEDPELCRAVLWNYELSFHGNLTPVIRAGIWKLNATDSIEHIQPQTPGAAWPTAQPEDVGRIGNLLLLPEKLNSAARNSGFTKKKKIYAQYHLRIVEEVCENQRWDASAIEDRTVAICEFVRSRWADRLPAAALAAN